MFDFEHYRIFLFFQSDSTGKAHGVTAKAEWHGRTGLFSVIVPANTREITQAGSCISFHNVRFITFVLQREIDYSTIFSHVNE